MSDVRGTVKLLQLWGPEAVSVTLVPPLLGRGIRFARELTEAAALVLRLRRHTRAEYASAVNMWGCLLFLAGAAAVAESAGAGAARLACYVEGAAAELQECSHVVYAGDARGDKLDSLLKEYRRYNPRAKIVLRVAEVDKVSDFCLSCIVCVGLKRC